MNQTQDYDQLVHLVRRAVGDRRELEEILQGISKIREDAYVNSVTGAPDGRRLQLDLPGIIDNGDDRRQNGALRQEKPIHITMMDVDNFGNFNKEYGEETGNAVLRAVSQIIHKTFRTDDFVGKVVNTCHDYHLHGEEMIAIYTCKTIQDAYSVADRVRANVQQESEDKTGHRVTISLGVTLFDSEKEDYQTAQNRADTYMQFAKREGKNRVYCGELDPLFQFKEKLYAPCIADALAKKIAESVKGVKGKIGRTATQWYNIRYR